MTESRLEYVARSFPDVEVFKDWIASGAPVLTNIYRDRIIALRCGQRVLAFDLGDLEHIKYACALHDIHVEGSSWRAWMRYDPEYGELLRELAAEPSCSKVLSLIMRWFPSLQATAAYFAAASAFVVYGMLCRLYRLPPSLDAAGLHTLAVNSTRLAYHGKAP